MDKKHLEQLENRNMPRLILSKAWPAMFSMTLQAIYGVVDSIYIAYVSEDAIAAIGLTFPIQMLTVGVGVGTGIGVNSLISRSLGAKEYIMAEKAANTGFKLTILSWIPFLILGLFFSENFMSYFSTNDTIISEGSMYLGIITALSVFFISGMILEKIIQATGNMIFPMIANIIGVLINITLDPILIFGYFGMPKLGLAGAAIATIFSELIFCAILLIYAFKRLSIFNMKIFGHKADLHTIKEIYKVGFPSMLIQTISSISFFLLNLILSEISEVMITVMSIYGRVQSFIFMPVFGLSSGLMPIMGFSYGAKNKKRFTDSYKYGLLFAMIIMGIGLFIFQVLPAEIIDIFNPSTELKIESIRAFRIISLCFLPAGFGIITSILFQSAGHGFLSLIQTIIRQLLGIIPVAFLLASIGDGKDIWYTFFIGDLLGIIFAGMAFKRLMKKDLGWIK